MSSKIEKTPTGLEQSQNTHELEAAGSEHREALRDSLEKAERRHKDKNNESLQEVRARAIDTAQPAVSTEKSPAEKRSTLITKRHREQSFAKQMDSIRPHLSKREQTISKVIHNKQVEAMSETAASTIARPNALLAGSICAFVLVTVLYFVAKHYGYQLSGFETIGAFGIGWLIGMAYDYIRVLVHGNK